MSATRVAHDTGVTGDLAAAEIEGGWTDLGWLLGESRLTEATVSPVDYILGLVAPATVSRHFGAPTTWTSRVVVESHYLDAWVGPHESYIRGLVRTHTVAPLSEPAKRSHAPKVEPQADVMAESFPTKCFKELCSWLDVSKRQLFVALDISPSTYYSWDERGSKPRASSTSLLYRVHGIVKLVVRHRGVSGAREWFHSGAPCNIEAIFNAAKDPAGLDQLAKSVYAEFSTRVNFSKEVPAIPGEDAPVRDKTPEGWGL